MSDYSGQYNTKLSVDEEAAYLKWAADLGAAQGRDVGRDVADYDMRGFYKSGKAQSENGHFTDEFKKPNHPTFSDQSKYHGKDGNQGGTWEEKDGAYTFTPGKTNLAHHTAAELADYFAAVEPGNKLIIPPSAARVLFPAQGILDPSAP
jgi:hypothetical protein